MTWKLCLFSVFLCIFIFIPLLSSSFNSRANLHVDGEGRAEVDGLSGGLSPSIQLTLHQVSHLIITGSHTVPHITWRSFLRCTIFFMNKSSKTKDKKMWSGSRIREWLLDQDPKGKNSQKLQNIEVVKKTCNSTNVHTICYNKQIKCDTVSRKVSFHMVPVAVSNFICVLPRDGS